MKLLHSLALLLALTGQAATAERTPARPSSLSSDGDGVIVTFKRDATTLRQHALSAAGTASHATTLTARAAALGARHGMAMIAGAAASDRAQVVRVDGLSTAELMARLATDPDVEMVERNSRRRIVATPNDPLFSSGGANGPAVGQWYLRAPTASVVSAIDAVSAWDTTQGSASIVVAVVDTGFTDHPDLAGKLLPGYDMVADTRIANDGNGRDADAHDPGDWLSQTDINANATFFAGCDVAASSWHGTQVAGLIAATTNNQSGMAGAGWDVRVLPVRVLGKCFGDTVDIIAGMRWAAGLAVPGVPTNPNPARVINLSLGSSDPCSPAEAAAIAEINALGVVVVASAGNSVGHAAGSPANCPGVIGVAGLRHAGSKVGFSDVGSQLSIAAPAGNCVNDAPAACLFPILTTVNKGAQGPGTFGYTDSFNISVGTSFSSPLVAATTALMLSVQPGLTPAGLRSAMQASARPFPQSGLPDDPIAGPVQLCHAPDGLDQGQCYCTTSTCGAGMLDAGAAVRAASGIHVAIDVAPTSPQAGQALALSGGASTVAPGRSVAGYQWSLVDAGSTGGSFTTGTSGATATLQTSAGGTLTVRLVVTDDHGVSVASQQAIAVAASTTQPPAAASGGGGGGAMSAAWLLALLLATWALRRPISHKR